MILIGIMLLILQLILLMAIVRNFHLKSDIVLLKFFNPSGFLFLFYFLFFVIEQIVYISSGFNIIGLEPYPLEAVRNMFLKSQSYLILFLFGIFVGSFFIRPRKKTITIDKFRNMIDNFPGFITVVTLIVFFICGIIANIYLGKQYASLTIQQGAFRSQLVKSSSGLLVTTIGFFGNFAFLAIEVYLLKHRRFLFACGIFIIFSAAIMYTGARGRLMWPLLLVVMSLFSYKNTFPFTKIMSFSVFGVLILSILDPLRKSLVDRSYQFDVSNIGLYLSGLLSGRNFDGFSNFTVIIGNDNIPISILHLFKGIRVEFMTTYFPGILERGVAFGTTLPGYFYCSGGILGLFGFSILFGISMMVINNILRNAKSIWLIYGYFFAMVWYMAIGGDFIESFKKLIAATSPSLVPIMYTIINKYLKSNYPV